MVDLLGCDPVQFPHAMPNRNHRWSHRHSQPRPIAVREPLPGPWLSALPSAVDAVTSALTLSFSSWLPPASLPLSSCLLPLLPAVPFALGSALAVSKPVRRWGPA